MELRCFDRTNNILKSLIEKKLVNGICVTITKENCNHLWEIYRYAKDLNVHVNFRLASEIQRLYNSDLKDNFTFTEEEKLRIIKFLENIIFYYEKNNIDRQFLYLSIIEQFKGRNRAIGCTWRTSKGLSLDPYGNIYFCFPKSKKVKNLNNKSDYDISLLKKNSLKLLCTHKYCKQCSHDYYGVPNVKFILQFFYKRHFQHFMQSMHNNILLNKYDNVLYKKDRKPCLIRKISIMGWYGTETLGDKAILGGIITNLFRDGIKEQDITIISLNPTYTRLTLYELGLTNIQVVDTHKVKNDKTFISNQDLFVFGGGPLCDIEEMYPMLE